MDICGGFMIEKTDISVKYKFLQYFASFIKSRALFYLEHCFIKSRAPFSTDRFRGEPTIWFLSALFKLGL